MTEDEDNRKKNDDMTVGILTVYDRQTASSPVINVPGGIDFNPNHLNLKERGEEVDINFTNLPMIQPETVNGITPVIFSIVPITNFPFLLGISQEDSQQLSHLP